MGRNRLNGRIPFRIEEWDELSRLIVAIDTESLPFGGRWIYDLEEIGVGESGHATRLTRPHHAPGPRDFPAGGHWRNGDA